MEKGGGTGGAAPMGCTQMGFWRTVWLGGEEGEQRPPPRGAVGLRCEGRRDLGSHRR